MEASSNAGCTDFQPADTDWQTEPARARAAGIEIQYAVFCCLRGFVGMAADDRSKAASAGIEIERIHVVQDINLQSAQFHNLGFHISQRPGLHIHVTMDSSHLHQLL